MRNRFAGLQVAAVLTGALALAGGALAAGPNAVTFTENIATPHTTSLPAVFNVAGRVIPAEYLCPAGVTDQPSCTPRQYFTQCGGTVTVVAKIAGNASGGLKPGTTVATASNLPLNTGCTYAVDLSIPKSALIEHGVAGRKFVRIAFTASYSGSSYFEAATAPTQYALAKGAK